MTSPSAQNSSPQASFRHAFRGYDTGEVQRFVHELTARMDTLRNEHQLALSRLAELEGPDREAQIDELTQDINRILHAAHAAAQNLRERAATEVSQFVSTSTEEAQRKLRQAEDDAFALRKDAWETAESLLDDVVAHVRTVQTQAEKDALAIVGEAERTAHRKLASANREADTVLKSARLEGEQIKVAAQAERDAMLEDARKSTTAAQERVRALELRRDELLADLNARPTVEARTSGAEGTALRPGSSEIASTAIKVVRPGDPPSPPAQAWMPEDDNDTVRVIQPNRAESGGTSDSVRVVPGGDGVDAVDDDLDVDGAAIADEVRRLHDDARSASLASADRTPAAPAPEPETAVSSAQRRRPLDAGSPADPAESRSHASASEPSPSPRIASKPAEPVLDLDASTELAESTEPADLETESKRDLDAGVIPVAPMIEPVEVPAERDVHAKRRPAASTVAETGPGSDRGVGTPIRRPVVEPDRATTEIDALFGRLREQAAPVLMPAPQPTTRAVEPDGAVTVSEDTPLSDLVAPDAVEPFDERDRRLLPMTNRVLRSIKRELSEHQNLALESLRTEPDTWSPDTQTFASAVGSEFTILHNEAFGAGSGAAAAITGQPDPRSKPFDLAENPVIALAAELQADLVAALDKGRTAGQGVRELSASVSRVYRAWRTDLAERKVRDLASAAYHRGMRAAYADLGVHKIRLHLMGAGCEDCRAHAERPFDSGDPSGDAPPLHSECTCTFLPN